jgi:hypothetical protein
MLENRNYFLLSPFTINHVGPISFNHGDTPSPRAAKIGLHDLKQGKAGEEIPTNLLLFWIVVLDENITGLQCARIPFRYFWTTVVCRKMFQLSTSNIPLYIQQK